MAPQSELRSQTFRRFRMGSGPGMCDRHEARNWVTMAGLGNSLPPRIGHLGLLRQVFGAVDLTPRSCSRFQQHQLPRRQQGDEVPIKGHQAVTAGEHSRRNPAITDGVAHQLVLSAERLQQGPFAAERQ